MTQTEVEIETLDEFRTRARTWIRANLAPADPAAHIGVLRKETSDADDSPPSRTTAHCSGRCSTPGLPGSAFPASTAGRD